MTRVVVDLDEAVGQDIEVVLGERSYMLPADLPAELFVRLQTLYTRWADEGEDADEDQSSYLRDLDRVVLDIFRLRTADLVSQFADEDVDGPRLLIGPKAMGVVVGTILETYAQGDELGGEEAPLAKRSSASGSGTGSRPSKGSTGGSRTRGAKSGGKS